MPAYDVRPELTEESGASTQDNKRIVQEAKFSWTALASAPATDNTAIIEASSGLFLGMQHPSLPFVFANSINTAKLSPNLYRISATFTGRGMPGQSPLDEPPIIDYDWAVNEELIDVTYENKPMVFVTGEAPDPPIRDSIYDQIIRITRNLAWVNADMFTTYAGATNSDYFMGRPPGTCRLVEPPKASSRTYENFEYWQASMGIQVRRGVPGLYEDSKAWHKRVLAQGYYVAARMADANGNIVVRTVRAYDQNNELVTKPVLHDPTGQYAVNGVKGGQIPYDQNTGLQDPNKAQWYEWLPWTRRPLPFAALQVI